MPITIQSLGLSYHSYQLYDVDFFGDTIKTLVTDTPCIIDTWISDTERLHSHRLDHLIVGLDIEWPPNYNSSTDNPPATLQLCVGRNCLIIQLKYLPDQWPESLLSFLSNEDYRFVGVGIDGDADKLYDHFGVNVGNTVDLREVAAEGLGQWWLRTAGLKKLVREVLNYEIEKPRNVTLSDWDDDWLSLEQIQYACVDAYASFEIDDYYLLDKDLEFDNALTFMLETPLEKMDLILALADDTMEGCSGIFVENSKSPGISS